MAAVRGAGIAALLGGVMLGGVTLSAVARTGTPDPAATLPGGLLAAPGDYSFERPNLLSGGVAEQSFGSNGARSTAVRVDNVLPGGTRVFVAAGAAQTPHWRDVPSVTVSTVAAGVQTETPIGLVTLGVSGGQARVPGR